MRKVRIGDIIENLHASENNPHRKGVVVNVYKTYINLITLNKNNNKIERYCFYRKDVENDEEGWIIKGNINLKTVLKNILNKY